MPQKTTVHNFTVTYEENALDGVRYLRDDLDENEIKPFFSQAREHGSAEFEDDEDHQFTLLYQGGTYILVRR